MEVEGADQCWKAIRPGLESQTSQETRVSDDPHNEWRFQPAKSNAPNRWSPERGSRGVDNSLKQKAEEMLDLIGGKQCRKIHWYY